MPTPPTWKLTDERPLRLDIRLSLLATRTLPLGIAEDMENENRPFILGTPFLTTAKASIKFDTGTITLRSGKHKASPRMGRKDKASLGKGDAV
ncbi:hypothetical protein Tco_0635092 [Tanacetum coccineum]